MIDNLKDAITHAKEVAKEFREKAKLMREANGLFYPKDFEDCETYAENHEQLAEWLTELAERREADRWIPIDTEKDLPKESGFYLVTMEYRDSVSYKLRRVTAELFFSTIFQKWSECNSEDSEDGIIAWKPLPEPCGESEAEVNEMR